MARRDFIKTSMVSTGVIAPGLLSVVAVAAGLKARADGLILFRKYSEMRLANLEAAGRAVREFRG